MRKRNEESDIEPSNAATGLAGYLATSDFILKAAQTIPTI